MCKERIEEEKYSGALNFNRLEMKKPDKVGR